MGAKDNVCSGGYPICCDKKDGLGAVCQSTSNTCSCNPTMPLQTCQSPYPVCCVKVPISEPRCYSSTTGCQP
ncbi:MAG: hypothetical protein DYH12_08830 [Sorangiineae bacterium PRO1]|nr:hypothetical protein [Sorangiineae bacterium PRO1]